MKLRRLLAIAFMLGLFISLVILLSSFFSREPPYRRIILNAIELRNVGNNSVAKARLVSELDSLVQQTKHTEVKTHWQRLTECMAECSDDTYFDLVVASAIEGQETVPNAKLVGDLVVTNRFWGANDVVEFSRALASADEAIGQMRSKMFDRQWGAVIACDGKCEEKNDLFFDLIRVVVSQEV
ncbi:MAG: hypothetical protein HY363_05030 [Candidatus Aenigmarchaeota archaeon]|nr:hypothetical protein [Candidatus Aenigmarchaeota archaeon]